MLWILKNVKFSLMNSALFYESMWQVYCTVYSFCSCIVTEQFISRLDAQMHAIPIIDMDVEWVYSEGLEDDTSVFVCS